MDNRSLSRELSLISLGLINDEIARQDFDIRDISLDTVLESAVDFMVSFCREELDQCESLLNVTSNNFFEIELSETDNSSSKKIREDLQDSIHNVEKVMNILSDAIEIPKIIVVNL